MVRWGTGRGKAKSYRRQKVPICVYDKYPYFSPIDPGRSWLVCSFPAPPRGFAGAKWISWGPSSRHVCINLSWRVSEGLISNGFETRLQELTQINAIMPIKWVDRSVLISRILKSTYDLQLSGSRILLEKIPTVAFLPAEARQRRWQTGWTAAGTHIKDGLYQSQNSALYLFIRRGEGWFSDLRSMEDSSP